MDPVFEVNPFLAQGAAKEVYKKLFEMLRDVVHMALVARPWEQPVAGHQDWIELHFLSPPLLTTRPGVGWMQVDLVFTTSVR